MKLAGNALDEVRRRVQQAALHRRGHKDDPLYRIRRTLLTGTEHLTDRQRQRLEQLFADADVQVEGIRGTYQRIINRLPPNPTGPVAAR